MTADRPAELSGAVARLLGTALEAIRDVRREPVEYDAFLAGRTLVRVRGTAVVSGEPVPWSLVEKRTDGPSVASAYLYDNAIRELAAYRSGLLADLAPGIGSPSLLGAHEGDDGSVTLRLEDLDAGETRTPLSQGDVLTAAGHLGRLAGSWVDRVPDHPWLFRGWIARHQQVPTLAEGLALVRGAVGDAGVEERLGGRVREAVGLLEQQPDHAATLGGLPHTLCHHDAVAANVFVTRRDGEPRTVLIDWESIGPGPVGADLASLLFASPRRGDYPSGWFRDLVPVAIDAYQRGVTETGAPLAPDTVRLGVHASIALRWALVRDVIRLIRSPAMARRGSAPHESSEEALDELVALVPPLLDSAAEARRLMTTR
jgi:hypothetical protein